MRVSRQTGSSGHSPLYFRDVSEQKSSILRPRSSEPRRRLGRRQHRDPKVGCKENTRLLQIGAIDEAVEDAGLPTVEDDKVALLSLCDMDHTELQIYAKMIEVYDRARSHFLFEIVELQVKRYLNAERLKAQAEANPRVLLYSDYKELFLERTQNSELTQDLLSYILKPREEEGCPIYLWAAELNFGEQAPDR
jgi:hypothetical protein